MACGSNSRRAKVGVLASVVIYKECSLAMAASQLMEHQQHASEVFEKKHTMECTTVVSTMHGSRGSM